MFVHGLNGDKETTWLSSGQPREFWPDWLQADIPGLAVWSLGYPASATYWKPGAAMALQDRAANALPLLLDEPTLEDGSITFVAYSLGGLLIKEILRAADTQAHHNNAAAGFLARVRRVAFIGTPHFGSDLASIAKALSYIIRPRETVLGLPRNDPHLRDLNTWFRAFAERQKVGVIVLRETRPIRLLSLGALQCLVVKPDSSDPGLSPSTPIIPLDEDHDSIRAPQDRNAQIYTLLRSFLVRVTDTPTLRPATPRHPATYISDYLGTESRVEEATTRAGNQHPLPTGHEATPGLHAALSSSPNQLITREAEVRLRRIRQCRYIVGFDRRTECTRLLTDISTGELSATLQETKREIYAWCARVLATDNLDLAKQALDQAETLGEGQENAIAEAFLKIFADRGQKPAALAKLAALQTPLSRSASFLIAANWETPDVALKWLEQSGVSIEDLDADGKFHVIQRRMQAGDWTAALKDLEYLTESDYVESPTLLNVAAEVYLAQAIHQELRAKALQFLPENLATFPLAIDGEAMQFRNKARVFYEHASERFTALGQTRAAGIQSDYALWLGLRDPATANEARQALQESMSDPRTRLRRLPIALQFGLDLDLAAVEQDIDRETTLSGGKSPEAAIARFSLAMTKESPAEVASYIAHHRQHLSEYYNPDFLTAVEIEALTKSGAIPEARALLVTLQHRGIAPDTLSQLNTIIDTEEGAGDPVAHRERQYSENPDLPTLLDLVHFLQSRGLFTKLLPYSKSLFEETKDLPHAEIYVNALYQEGRDYDIAQFADTFPEVLEASETISTTAAWAQYRCGNLQQAMSLLDRLRQARNEPNDRHLFVNLAIASGDWSALGSFVESEWTSREDRDGRELLRAGQLAQRIGADVRSRELIRLAASKASGDAELLVGCYSAATSAGSEDEEEVHRWFEDAVKSSKPDGPVQQIDLKDLVDMQPGWNQQRERCWDMLLAGAAPMFAAAHTLRRSFFELFLIPAVANIREPDPRRRQLIFAFSGKRSLADIGLGKTALDISTIIALSFMGFLDTVIDGCEEVTIAHTTLPWLFEERENLQYHQPSRLKRAQELRRLLDAGQVRQFQASPAPADLESKVGEDIAQYLVAAAMQHTDAKSKGFVIRPFPLPRPGTLLEEIADTSGYEFCLAGCSDVVSSLKKMGKITTKEESDAMSYLGVHEEPWPHNPVVEPGSTLFLDHVAVSYFQYTGLLEKLCPAGFEVFISGTEVDHADALISHAATGAEAIDLLESIRSTLTNGIASGKIRLTSLPKTDEGSDNDLLSFKHHPSMVLFSAAKDVDICLVDDRFHNQYQNLDTEYGQIQLGTSLDAILALAKRGSISSAEVLEAFTKLRRAGFLLVPHRSGELADLVNAAPISGGVLTETAELRAVRESLLRIRMTDALQLPAELSWMNDLTREIIAAHRKQWTDSIPDEEARARSEWLLNTMDIRGWAHRGPAGSVDPTASYRAQILMLLVLPDPSSEVRKRYWEWLELAVLSKFREEEPTSYRELIDSIEALFSDGVDRARSGGANG